MERSDFMNQELVNLLNLEVANFTVMYTKLHNFHWFIKGRHFFQLHEKFEALYDEITLLLDETAERILMIGEKPLATLNACLEKTTIKEVDADYSETEMINELIDDYETINQEVTKGIALANNVSDDVTADLLVQIKSKFDKHLWMLKSFI
jgi:starvation-inducible DNA-binding protein